MSLGEIDTLGVTCCTGGVKRCRSDVFVEIFRLVNACGLLQKCLVLAVKQLTHNRFFLGGIGKPNPAPNAWNLVFKSNQQGNKIIMNQNSRILSMIYGVENLLGRQAHVDGMQDGTDHRDCEKTFEITV